MFSLKRSQEAIHYYNVRDNRAKQRFSSLLVYHFRNALNTRRPLVFLCIGSDRATGDALGPLVGQNIQDFKNTKRVFSHTLFVYGSLSEPVHAINLTDTVNRIYQNHSHPYIIAIDASLGIRKHIGYVTLGHGPLTPGVGVGKRLPAVGNAHITGIVNSGTGNNLNQILQTTRLSTVIELSNFVSEGILDICSKMLR